MTRLPTSLLLVLLTTQPLCANESVALEISPSASGSTLGKIAALLPEMDDRPSLGEWRCPGWTGRVVYFYRWHDDPNDALDHGPDGDEECGFSNLQLRIAGMSGVQVSVREDELIGVRMPCFGLDNPDDFAPLQIVPPSSVDTLPTSIALPYRPWSVRYEFEFQNIELTNRRKAGPFDVTFGIRYVDLDRSLQFLATPRRGFAPSTTRIADEIEPPPDF